MEIIITQVCKAFIDDEALRKWARTLDDNPDSSDFDPMSYLAGDPDKMKCNGRELHFIETELDGTRYVLTNTEVNDVEREVLTHFWQDNFTDYFKELPCTWAAYDKADNVIAYRGGSGYVYSIWGYQVANNPIN